MKFPAYFSSSLFLNFGLASYFLTMLLFKGSHNIGSFLLILIGLTFSIYAMAKNKKFFVTRNTQDRYLIASFCLYFAIFVISMWLNQGRWKELDNPSRALLALPLLTIFYYKPFKLDFLLKLIPIGAIIAGIVSIIQRFVLHYDRAFLFQMHIQSGDIAMSLALFSLICGAFFIIKKQSTWALVSLFGTMLAMFASLLSTARGGWIGVPVLIFIIVAVYAKYLPKKWLVGIGSAFALLLTVAVLTPQTQILNRIDVAKTEIVDYFEKHDGASSIGARFDMWKSALLMSEQKPILGWGIEGAKAERKLQAEQGIVDPVLEQFGHAHNQFLDDLSKRGIIGLFALLMIFYVPLKSFWNTLKSANLQRKTIALLGVVHILSVGFYCLSQGFFTHNSGSIFYFLICVIFYGALRNVETQHSEN